MKLLSFSIYSKILFITVNKTSALKIGITRVLSELNELRFEEKTKGSQFISLIFAARSVCVREKAIDRDIPAVSSWTPRDHDR